MIDSFIALLVELWTKKRISQDPHTAEDIERIRCELMTSTYRFSPMKRYFLPKANKPGQTRPITEPNKRFFLVLRANIMKHKGPD